MTLRADGIAEVVGSDGQGRCELQLSRTRSVTCTPDVEPESPGTLAWRFENGNFIFTDEDGEHAILVGAGGRMMVMGQANEFVPEHSWTNILVAMRLPN